jgi:GNAT superfamily N-acetyltransferase
MQITHPTESDWQLFLDLARQEGWRVPPQELTLFCGYLADCAFVLKDDGAARGFVTAVAHGKSSWIGNLLVPAECRGRGYGTLLFDHALAALAGRGVGSIWLTASPLGRPIYEKKGFRGVDGVERWTLRAVGEPVGVDVAAVGAERLLAADALVWRESRRSLLDPLAAAGEVFASGGTVALLQGGDGMRVIGPWVSPELCPRENRLLLTALLAAAGEGVELVADVLASSPLKPLLNAAGFAGGGRSALMVRGEVAGIDLSRLVSLASLGSMG